jgi:hypothetical protein
MPILVLRLPRQRTVRYAKLRHIPYLSRFTEAFWKQCRLWNPEQLPEEEGEKFSSHLISV